MNSAASGGGGGGGNGNQYCYAHGSSGSNGIACGGIQSSNSQVINTLFTANLGGNCVGQLVDLGHNLSSDGTCGFSSAGSRNNLDPKLGSLADNGGPTLTMAPLPGSPAIDAGDTSAAPAADQRGVGRPFGSAADIGAVEYNWLFLSLARASGTVLNLTACSYANQPCQLLASTDFVNWISIGTNHFGANGTVLFTDDSAGSPQKYYRLILE
jgi:hypothetical protein